MAVALIGILAVVQQRDDKNQIFSRTCSHEFRGCRMGLIKGASIAATCIIRLRHIHVPQITGPWRLMNGSKQIFPVS